MQHHQLMPHIDETVVKITYLYCSENIVHAALQSGSSFHMNLTIHNHRVIEGIVI